MKQYCVHGEDWFSGAWERFTYVINLGTLFSFVMIFAFPWPVLAVETEVSGVVPLNLRRDKFLSDGTLIVIGSWLQPDNKVVLIVPPSLSASASLGEGSVIKALVYAYSSEPNQTDNSPEITAAGTRAAVGTAAANFLPLGATIMVENEMYTIFDRMNSRYDGKYVIDIWQSTAGEARQHGIKIRTVEIVSLP